MSGPLLLSQLASVVALLLLVVSPGGYWLAFSSGGGPFESMVALPLVFRRRCWDFVLVAWPRVVR
jgi:hypothetical protein